MASVTVDPGERLTVESIPVVDLRFLTQSELSALSRCSIHAVDLSRCDDVVIPKIDRSVFNESAGSRKQTYSRFRLARRKPDFSGKPLPLAPGPALDDPERLDNSKIISLFKQLFAGADPQAADLVPITESPLFDGLETTAASKKRGRKPKGEDLAFSGALVVYNDDAREGSDKVFVNSNGVVVDLEELAKLDDPYAAEIRRRTQGMDKDEDLLGFLTSMEGQWGSRRKRRKVVDANEFGDALPNGWKVLLGMKKKQGQCWLFCRRYISPNGRYFMSCKEVSSYLMSLCGFTDVKPPPPSGHCSEASQLDNQLVLVNAETTPGKGQEASLVTFEPDETVKQNILVKDSHIGILEEVGLFRCHKCSTPFYEKNHLLHHLLSCHKRKRRKSGMPVEDDELMKEGHYECQFCNKRFTERVCFFGHVGIHVKNYVKSLEESPGVNPMQNDHGPISAGGIPTSFLEKSESMEVNDDSVPYTLDIASDLNVDPTCGKLLPKSDPKVPAQSGDHEAILSSADRDQSNIASGTDRTAVKMSTDMADAVSELVGKEVTGTENCSDIADLEFDSSSGNKNDKPIDEKNDTCQASIEDSVIVEAADVIVGGSKLQVQNTNGLVSEIQNSAGLLNDGHEFRNEGEDDCNDQMISKSELLGKDRKKPVNENTEARLHNDIVGEPNYSMEFKHGVVDNELMFSSHDSEIGKKMIVTSEALQEINPASSSVIPRGKEDTISLPESLSGRKSEQCSSAQGDVQEHVLGVDPNAVSLSSSHGVDLGTNDFMKNEVPFDADSFDSSGRGTQSVFVLPGEVISHGVPENANTGSAFRVLEPRKDDICVNIPFPSSIVLPREEHRYRTESSSPCRASSRAESNTAEVVNSSDFFNPKSSLDASHVANKQAVKFLSSHLYAPLGSREVPDASNVFGTCSSVIEASSKQERESAKLLSSRLSIGGHAHCLTGQIHETRDSMNDNSSAACATHLPDLSGSISDINTGVLPSFPPQTIPASPSPFSLWNDQPFGVDQSQSRICDNSRDEGREDRCSEPNSLSLASFQQTCNVGYNLNETYISTVDNFSRLNPLETHRDTDLMIGFRNLNARSNQDVVSEALWRSNEGNVALGDSSSSHSQLTGAFQPFDFLSDKGENDIFSVDEKYDNIANFGGLRSTTVEPLELSFLTPQHSNPQLGGPKVLSYGNAGIEQGFESSVWLGKDASLPSMNARSSFSTVCVWCGSQFQQESLDSDTQAGSIGYLCPTCKARISGQF